MFGSSVCDFRRGRREAQQGRFSGIDRQGTPRQWELKHWAIVLDLIQEASIVTKIFYFLLATAREMAKFRSPSYGKIKLDRTKQTQTSNGGKVCQP
jgi:hypothetical protein